MIYMDNAATTKLSERVLKKMIPYFRNEYGNPSSVHPLGVKAKSALTDAREACARALGCSPDEILFSSGGSEADNQAIISAAKLGATSGRKHIISSEIEHPAVLNTLKMLQKYGFTVTLLRPNKEGFISVEQVENQINDETCLVSIMYVNNEIGTIQPIPEIGAVCKKAGVIFHTDAVQAASLVVGHVKKLNVDLLSLSAHKFHGPKGVGLLYHKRKLKLTPIISGGSQEFGLRAGTENIPGIIGMATALQDLSSSTIKNSRYVKELSLLLEKGLSHIPHVKNNSPSINKIPGIVNFSFESVDGEGLLYALSAKGVCCSAGSACSSKEITVSHVLTAIGLNSSLAKCSLRFSINNDNTKSEVLKVISDVAETVAYIRTMSPEWREKNAGNIPFLTEEIACS